MPQLRYTIVTSSTLMLVGSLTYFDVIFILTGGGPGIATRLLPLHMYLSGFAFNEMGYASAIAVVLVVAGLLSLGLVRFSGFARMESHQEGVMATVTTLIVVVPLYWIVVTSLRSQAGFFTTSPLPPPTNPTLDNYRLVLESGFFRFLANSTIVTLAAVYDALQVWNGFLFPLILTQSAERRVLPLALWTFQGQFTINVPAILAAVILPTLPIPTLYVFGRRYLVSGLTAGFSK